MTLRKFLPKIRWMLILSNSKLLSGEQLWKISFSSKSKHETKMGNQLLTLVYLNFLSTIGRHFLIVNFCSSSFKYLPGFLRLGGGGGGGGQRPMENSQPSVVLKISEKEI